MRILRRLALNVLMKNQSISRAAGGQCHSVVVDGSDSNVDKIGGPQV